MARPKHHPHEQRNARLPAPRVTEAELAVVELQADRAGLSSTELVRQCVLSAKVKPRRGLADAQLLSELNRIGVNLNQIAHALNCGRTRDMHRLNHALARLEGIFNDIETHT